MSGKSYIRRNNGKDYLVTPGENGSYVSIQKTPTEPPTFDSPTTPSKIITAADSETQANAWNVLNKRKSKIIQGTPPVAANRG